jgi:hypothetical protein
MGVRAARIFSVQKEATARLLILWHDQVSPYVNTNCHALGAADSISMPHRSMSLQFQDSSRGIVFNFGLFRLHVGMCWRAVIETAGKHRPLRRLWPTCRYQSTITAHSSAVPWRTSWLRPCRLGTLAFARISATPKQGGASQLPQIPIPCIDSR